MSLNRTSKLKILLLSVVLFTIGGMVIVFINDRHEMDNRDEIVSIPQSDASISIGKVHQTAVRNGVKEWSLDARSADYIEADGQAIFEEISVHFFLENNKQVYLRADKGILKTDSNDIDVMGNVEMKSDGYRLNTESLHYEHNRRIIFSRVPVKIVGDSFDVAADTMSFNLDTNKTFLEGNVEGIFGENIRL